MPLELATPEEITMHIISNCDVCSVEETNRVNDGEHQRWSRDSGGGDMEAETWEDKNEQV